MAIVTAVILVSVSVLVWVSVRQLLLVNTDSALLSVAHSEEVNYTGAGRMPSRPSQGIPSALELASAKGYRMFGAIVGQNGRIVAQSNSKSPQDSTTLTDALRQTGTVPRFAFATYSHMPVRMVTYRVRGGIKSHVTAVMAAISLRPYLRSLNALLVVLTATTIFGTAFSALISRYVARILTAPLVQIADEARKTEAITPGYRISANFADADLCDVANALNTMLSRRDAAYEQVNELLEIQSQFSADASHELRSPLSNLTGMFEVALRRERLASEYREVIREGLVEIRRLTSVTNDLLTLARSDANQLHLQIDTYDIADLASESCNAFKSRAEFKGITIERQLDSVLLPCDNLRIREVIDNLLDNAVRLAPAGTKITVGTCQLPGYGSLWVEDNGPGLSEGELHLVFRRFYRSDRSRSRDSGGSGLGLAICHAIAEAHGGNLSAAHVAPTGARFTLNLPSIELQHAAPY